MVAARAAALSRSSTATMITESFRAAARRAIFAPHDLAGDQDILIPLAAITSASPNLAQVTPIAPAAISRWAISES